MAPFNSMGVKKYVKWNVKVVTHLKLYLGRGKMQKKNLSYTLSNAIQYNIVAILLLQYNFHFTFLKNKCRMEVD